MSKVNYTYDTAAIRREARKILSCSNQISYSALPRVDAARNVLEGEFIGQTADALDETLVQARKQLRTLNEELYGLYTALSRYADALEEADDRLARMFDR